MIAKPETADVSVGRSNVFHWLRGRDLNPRPLGYERVQADWPHRVISPNTNVFNMLAR